MKMKISKLLIAISASTIGFASATSIQNINNDIDVNQLIEGSFKDDTSSFQKESGDLVEDFNEFSKESIERQLSIIEERILGEPEKTPNEPDIIEVAIEDTPAYDIIEEIIGATEVYETEINHNIEDSNNIDNQEESKEPKIINRDNVVHLTQSEKDELKNEILSKNRIDSYKDSELIFLNNLPVGTKLIFKKDYVVLPKTNSIIIQNGIVVLDKPDIRATPSSYCSIQLTNSGRARVIKEGRDFIIVKNQSNVKKVSNINLEKGPMKIQKQTIWVNNDHIKNISCFASSYMSDEKLPIMIYDLYKETDRNIMVAFPAFEEI